jgi:membrane-bound serine protease (ClpP class)
LRRLAIALAVLGVAGIVITTAGAAGAQDAPGPSTAPVDVFEVSGYIDAPVADGIARAITRAEHDGAQALVLQMNSPGAVLSRGRMTELAQRIHDSSVPVTIWVGPSGSSAKGLAGQLLGAAVVTGMAPGSRIGDFGDLLQLAAGPLDFGSATARLRTGTLGETDARAQGALKVGVNDTGTPTLGDFIVVLDGVQAGAKTLDTATVVQKGSELRRERNGPTRFAKLGILPRLMHTVASPPVAYLLLTIGFCLLVFEFFTAGVGIAGAVGAGCIVLGCYGAAALPTRPWAFALLALSILAFAIDVQTGVPRFWTGMGVVAYVVASVFLYDGMTLSWITLLAGIGGVLLAFLAGMPAMVRTRFATPTIGREWMIGETGEAVVAVDPDGVAVVRGAQWRATTNRATPIPAGDPLRVVAIDGITLEVEPLVGAAQDYRERARRRRGNGASTAAPDAAPSPTGSPESTSATGASTAPPAAADAP